MNDTICAIATSQGVGAIAIIRVSGDDSINIVNKIFKGKDLLKVKTHTINYGYIVDKCGKIIDEVLVSVMLSPKTFTTENTVEINTHGGIACTNQVLELLLENGCRLAEPGEFTKRAFLNGRIDLLEAEAVMDKINAQTEIQNTMASNQLSGKVSELINNLRDDMVQVISNINVNIDYPEYDDVDIITNEILLPKITNLKSKITKIISESKNGKIIKDGIKTCIIGQPNVGKSSLLNALLQEDKAIVTDIAGTTRDIVEGTISIDGIILNMIDTAGTITNAANALKDLGATAVYAGCTHGVLSGPALERINSSAIEDLAVLNTIPLPEGADLSKFTSISVAPLFAEAIRRIYDDEPISKLFEV